MSLACHIDVTSFWSICCACKFKSPVGYSTSPPPPPPPRFDPVLSRQRRSARMRVATESDLRDRPPPGRHQLAFAPAEFDEEGGFPRCVRTTLPNTDHFNTPTGLFKLASVTNLQKKCDMYILSGILIKCSIARLKLNFLLARKLKKSPVGTRRHL